MPPPSLKAVGMGVIISRKNKIKRRRCTDLLFLIIFFAALGFLGYVLMYALRHGDINKVIYGQDYMSDLCGQDNSIEATGMPEVVTAANDDLSLVEMLWPFSPPETREPFQLRRGMRDHTRRKFLYFSFPVTTPLAAWQSLAMCVEECPEVDANLSQADTPEAAALLAASAPSTWVCSGKYLNGPPAECPGGQGTAAACKAYRDSYYLYVPPEKAAACADPMADCDICYPPYKTIRIINFCMPDPAHALKAFQRAATAVGDLAVILAGGGNGADLAGSLSNSSTFTSDGTLEAPEGIGDIDGIRKSISTTPHLMYEDLVIAWPVIVGCTAVAFVFGLVYLVLLRLLAGTMVWLSLAAVAAGMGVGGWYLWDVSDRMMEDERYGRDDNFTSQADTARITFWVLMGVAGVYVLLVLLLRKKIALATRVVKASSMALNSLPLLLVLPTVFMLLSLVVLFYGLCAAALFVSTGEVMLGRTGFGHISLDGWSEAILVCHIICILWVVFFVRHVQYCTIGGAVSQWYFKRKELGRFPVLVALGTTLFYHTGSVAFGSLIITTMKVIRWLFLFLRKRSKIVTKRLPSASGRCAKGVCCYVACCLACFEKFLRALCRYAYAQIMLTGHPFAQSAAEAFTVLTTNLAGAATLRLIADAYLALGKILVAACCGALGACILLTESPYKEKLYSITAPVIAIVVSSLAVAMIFFGVYNMTIDTIFLCVCIEKDRKRLGIPTQGQADVALLLRDPDAPETMSDAPVSSTQGASSATASIDSTKSRKSLLSSLSRKSVSATTATEEYVPPPGGNPVDAEGADETPRGLRV